MTDLSGEIAPGVAASEQGTQVRTFLIADIRGYTRFTQEHGDEAAARLATRFAHLTREGVAARDGRLIELRGDEALAVFFSARQALRAAVDLQAGFGQETQKDPSLPLTVGIGLDAGEAIPVEGGYRGAALNLAARFCSLAGPGEVLASEGVVHLARKLTDLEYVERGAVQLKGFDAPVRVVEVRSASRPSGVSPSSDSPQSSQTSRDRPLPIGGYLGALPTGSLVARHEEMGKILLAVDSVAAGSGRLVLLAGEPGVGKTRLAQEVTRHVRNQGFLLAAGRCYAPRQASPFYPFLEALGMLYAAAPSAVRGEVPRRWVYLGRLLPNEDIAQPPPSASGGGDEHERLFWAVTGFIQAVAAETPLAVMLDDLHWADTSSLELLQHLARHTRGDRILLLGTYRDVEVGRKHPLEQALRDLHREQLLERVVLRRLDQKGTRDFLATSFDQTEVSEELASLIFKQTEGNPFFVQEVLHALVERGDIYQEDGHWERREIEDLSVPESVRSVIGERVARLGEESQDVLHEAAVLGQSFRFDDLKSLGDREELVIDATLEEAIAAGLIAEMGRDAYTFNHALTQHVLYGELSARRRRRLHLAAGEGLERAGKEQAAARPGGERRERRASELAWHFLEADDPDRALIYALLAGDEAADVYAHAEAERHYLTALELAREQNDESREAEALEKLGSVLVRAGRYDEALKPLERASDFYRAQGDLESECRVSTPLSWAHFTNGTANEGLARLERLLQADEGRVSMRTLAAMYESQALLFFGSGLYSEQLASAERLAEIARASDDEYTLATAGARRGPALSMLGRVEEGLSVSQETVRQAEASGNLFALWMAYANIAEAYEFDGTPHRAMIERQLTLDVAERLGDRGYMSFAHGNLAQTLVLLGEWGEARRHLEEQRKLTSNVASWYSAYPLLGLGELSVLEGEWEQAPRYLDEGMSIATRGKDLQAMREGERVHAELDLLNGHPEDAVRRLTPLLDRPGLKEFTVNSLLPVLAEAQLAVGKVDDAHETVARALERAATHMDRITHVQTMRVQGMTLTSQERWEEANRVFEETVSTARGIPYPLTQARTLSEWGLMHRTMGNQEKARDYWNEALAIFQRLGARKEIERTRALLADGG